MKINLNMRFYTFPVFWPFNQRRSSTLSGFTRFRWSLITCCNYLLPLVQCRKVIESISLATFLLPNYKAKQYKLNYLKTSIFCCHNIWIFSYTNLRIHLKTWILVETISFISQQKIIYILFRNSPVYSHLIIYS